MSCIDIANHDRVGSQQALSISGHYLSEDGQCGTTISPHAEQHPMQTRTRRGRIVLVSIDQQSTIPLYQQIYCSIRTQILDGGLPAGSRLPSTRQLASDLDLARSTVVQAYEQLRSEGYIAGILGAGTRVSASPPDLHLHSREGTPIPSSTRALGAVARRVPALIEAASLQSLSTGRPPKAFRAGVPATDLLPVLVWSRLLSRRWGRSTPRQLSYGEPLGFAPLRAAIADYLGGARGVRCTAGQIMIVSGAQQAIDLCARVLLDAGDRVWLEDPGYHGARGAMLAAGADITYVPVDDQGIVVQAGIAAAPNARLAYVTPSRQLPMGVEMSPSRRRALLEWARTNGSWIIEDDYDSEFRFASQPLPALQGQDSSGSVIYIGTFSKVMFPAMRLGYVVVPDALVDAFAATRHFMDYQSPFLEQAVMSDFMTEGHLERHIRRMRAMYSDRQAVLVDVARRELAGALNVMPSDAGMTLVGWLPQHDDAMVAQAASRVGVDTTALNRFSVRHRAPSGLLLGYAGVCEADIKDGVHTLARMFSAMRATA
jgi:GntR family transcriptional regulator/MocR family aminotransferase